MSTNFLLLGGFGLQSFRS